MSAVRNALLRLEPTAAAVFGTAAGRVLARRWRARGCAVLCYHAVREPGPFDDPSVVVAPDRFADQIEFLARHARIVGLDETTAPADGDRPRVAITFDDGYRDLIDHALPVLSRHDAPSAVFCCSQVVDGERALWWDQIGAALRAAPEGSHELPGAGRIDLDGNESRAAAFRRLRAHCAAAPEPLAEAHRVLAALPRGAVPDDLYLGPADLAEAERLGAEIGSHAASHARLSRLDPGALADELEGSRAALGRHVSRPVRGIAYPYGDAASVGPAVFDSARAAGYSLGFTGRTALASAAADPLAVPRVPIGRDDSPRAFRGKAVGAQPALYARAARAAGA